MQTYLGIFVVGVYMTEHGQDEGSRFACTRLWLGDQILWTERQRDQRREEPNNVSVMLTESAFFIGVSVVKEKVFIPEMTMYEIYLRLSQHHG